MFLTYQGILRANQIEWVADAPEHVPPRQPVRVLVTLLEQPAAAPDQGKRMAAALEMIAAGPVPPAEGK
jgi:hypothetical protein